MPELITTVVAALPTVIVLVPPVPIPIAWLIASFPILIAPAEELSSSAAEESSVSPPAVALRPIASAPVPADVKSREESKAPAWEIVKSSAAPFAVFVIVRVEFTASMSIPPALALSLIASATVDAEDSRSSVVVPVAVISKSSP